MNIALLVPVILGLVEVVKISGLPRRFLPLVAAILGVGYSLLVNGLTLESGILGLVAGLSSVGLYSGVTNTLQKRK